MIRFALVLVISAGPVGLTGRATAGWVTIKNETDQPVVVIETSGAHQQTRCGKPVRLMPGEVLREFQSCAGTKSVRILECGGRMQTLGKGEINWGEDNQAFSVRHTGRGVKVVAAAGEKLVCRAAPPDQK